MQQPFVGPRRPDSRVLEAIRAEWPDDRYEVSDTQIFAVKSNGGGSVFNRIETRLGEDINFHIVVVRTRYYHGRHDADLWEWLESHARIG